MATIWEEYITYSYGIPFGMFGIIFIFLTVIHKHANWFFLNAVLGVDWEDKNDDPKEKIDKELKQKRTISTYLFIDLNVDEEASIPPLNCLIRLVSDILVAGILSIFTSILFESLIMTRQNIKTGAQCPDFNAECFGWTQGQILGPFNCTKNDYTNFSVESPAVQCVAWVYQDKNINDVLGAIGTCGGLLGIIASIAPIVYFLSYHKSNCPLSCFCIILPLLPIGAGAFTIWYTLPEGRSNLTIFVFAVVIAMAFIGWFWAFYRSYLASRKRTTNTRKSECCTQCLLCYWPFAHCRSFRSFLCKKYKFYPWCCCYRHCMRKWPQIWEKNWKKHCEDEDIEANGAAVSSKVLSSVVIKIQSPLRVKS